MNKIEKILIIIFSLTAGLCLYIVTPYGLGLSPDAVGYLKGAEGLIEGQGLSYFNVQWPPLYPVLIAFFSWVTDSNVIDGARILSSFMIGVLFYLLANHSDNKNKIIWFIFSIEILIHPIVTHIYFYAWSEIPLLILMLLNFKYLNKLVNKKINNKREWIVNNSLIIFISILAVLTRYAGITILFTNIIVIFFILKKISLTEKIKLIIIHLSIFILIVSSWFAYSYFNFKSLTNRIIKFHPPELDRIENGLIEMGKWYLPTYLNLNTILYGCIGVLLIMYSFKNISDWQRGKQSHFERNNGMSVVLIYSVFSLVYLLFIIISISFIDIATPIDGRILVPIFIGIAICFCKNIENKLEKNYIKYIFITYIALITISSIRDLKAWSILSKYNGIELSSKEFKIKEINQIIKECDATIKLISDKPWEFDLYTKAKVDWLPSRNDMTSGLINVKYKDQMEKLKDLYVIIIVSEKNSEYVKEIDEMDNYLKMYSSQSGILWINKDLVQSAVCGKELKIK